MGQLIDKYYEIKQKVIEIAEGDENIKAVIAIGSSTRDTIKADKYSDLDIIIATDDVNAWLYGNLPEKLGDIKISFTEPTLGGGKERRVLYKEYLDVDMIIFSQEQFINVINEGIASWIMNRGYTVMYDAMDVTKLLKATIVTEVFPTDLTEKEYINMVNDFYFHVIWAAKKLLRGELWSAKMCMDAYLKNYLLAIIEMYTVSKYHIDVWHDGRFLDRWADEDIRTDLRHCFAHYDKRDMQGALLATEKLFARLARETAQMKMYTYPAEAEKVSENFVINELTIK